MVKCVASGASVLLQVDDVGITVVEMMSQRSSWTGTVTQLLELLDSGRTSLQRRLQLLAPNALRLSIVVNRLAPPFRRRSIDVRNYEVQNQADQISIDDGR